MPARDAGSINAIEATITMDSTRVMSRQFEVMTALAYAERTDGPLGAIAFAITHGLLTEVAARTIVALVPQSLLGCACLDSRLAYPKESYF